MAFTVDAIMTAAYNSPSLVGICLAVGYFAGSWHQKKKMRKKGMGGMGMM